jgi:hypothetical protein
MRLSRPVAVAAGAAGAAGLVVGGLVGFAIREPEVITRTVVRTRTVPLVPPECGLVVALASDLGPDLTEALDLIRDALDAVRRLDLSALGDLAGRSSTLAGKVQDRAPDLTAAIGACTAAMEDAAGVDVPG